MEIHSLTNSILTRGCDELRASSQVAGAEAAWAAEAVEAAWAAEPVEASLAWRRGGGGGGGGGGTGGGVEALEAVWRLRRRR